MILSLAATLPIMLKLIKLDPVEAWKITGLPYRGEEIIMFKSSELLGT